MCMECRPLIKAIDAYLAKVNSDLADELGAEGYLEPEKTLDYIQNIEDSVATVLLDETDYILEEIEKSVDLETFAADVWPMVKLNDAARHKLSTVFKENLSEFLPEFIGYYIAQTDRSLKLLQVTKRTTAWISSWSKELGELMQLNSHKEIERILKDGLSKGSGIAEFTRAIQDSGIRNEYYKARRVAVTEVLTAHRAAAQEAYMQSPAVGEKAWKHTGAYRNEPRQNHVDMDGKRVPVNKPFELKGADEKIYTPMYPGDPILPAEERVNCHCISQPIVDEDILGLPLEERQRMQQEAIDAMDDEWEKELDARNRAKAGIEIEPSSRSIYHKYQNEANPGAGAITQADGYKAGRHREEIAMANTLHETFGGNITLLTESTKRGISTPDYKWNGNLWELKSPKSEKKGDDLLRTARKQIEANPGGVIMDYQVTQLDMDKAKAALMSRFQRKDFPLEMLDVIICHQGNIIDILRFEK